MPEPHKAKIQNPEQTQMFKNLYLAESNGFIIILEFNFQSCIYEIPGLSGHLKMVLVPKDDNTNFTL